MTVVLGLTGSMGTGKSTISGMLAEMGADIFSADSEVHHMLAPGGAAEEEVKELFPEAIERDEISRKKLADIVFHDDQKLDALENIIHPRIYDLSREAIVDARMRGAKMLVLEVPLLFEKGAACYCDKSMVVYADRESQIQRLKDNRQMTEADIVARLDKQMSSEAKASMADYVVDNSGTKEKSQKQVERIFEELVNEQA